MLVTTADNNNDSASGGLVSQLDQLVEFQDYFKDKEKVSLLVDWIHEETGINKMAARLAVKHIAPFLLARLANLGKAVSKAWMNKLHDKLSQYNCYTDLVSNLVNILKTRTDKSFEQALNIPSEDNLNQLLEKQRWSNLKPEQQGLVRLMLGQQHANQQQAIVQNQLDNIIRQLSFELDLKSVASIQAQANKAQRGSALWLTYGNQQAKLVGRQKPLHRLDEFYQQDCQFSWWAACGAGGLGKSRLALESISQLEPLWHVGFLSTHKLDVPDALSHWSPIQPTVIVIDYVPQYSDQIANWIDHFIQHQDDYDFPVRLLILEREYKSQSWWTELTAGSSSALCRKSALFQNTGGLPLELLPLNQNEQYQVVESFLSSLHAQEKLPDSDNSIWQLINKLSVQGNPLFLGLVAVALANNSPSKIRQWQHNDLLNEIVYREKKAWERQLRNCDSQQKTQVVNLLCFSSIVSGFNWDDDEAAISHAMEQSGLVSSAQELALLWDKVKTLAGHDGGFIQPDLIAEYIILEHWPLNQSGPNQQIKAIFIAAYNSSFTIISQKTKPHAYKTSYSLF